MKVTVGSADLRLVLTFAKNALISSLTKNLKAGISPQDQTLLKSMDNLATALDDLHREVTDSQ